MTSFAYDQSIIVTGKLLFCNYPDMAASLGDSSSEKALSSSSKSPLQNLALIQIQKGKWVFGKHCCLYSQKLFGHNLVKIALTPDSYAIYGYIALNWVALFRLNYGGLSSSQIYIYTHYASTPDPPQILTAAIHVQKEFRAVSFLCELIRSSGDKNWQHLSPMLKTLRILESGSGNISHVL